MNLCCFRRPPPMRLFCRLNGGLKCIIGLTWHNMAYCAHHEWSGCLFRDKTVTVHVGFSTHYLTKQAELWGRAIDAGWSFLKAKSQFCILLFPFFLPNHYTVVTNFPRNLKYYSHISNFAGDWLIFLISHVLCLCFHLKYIYIYKKSSFCKLGNSMFWFHALLCVLLYVALVSIVSF